MKYTFMRLFHNCDSYTMVPSGARASADPMLPVLSMYIDGLCKTAVTPLLMHWSYWSLALIHRCDLLICNMWCHG